MLSNINKEKSANWPLIQLGKFEGVKFIRFAESRTLLPLYLSNGDRAGLALTRKQQHCNPE